MAAATGAWFNADQALRTSRASVVAHQLEPMAALLKENQEIIAELQTPAFTEKDAGILESYLLRIRRDGVPKNAQMKEKLDRLAENNTALETLISVYSPGAKTASFAAESSKFRRYSIAWRDRWNSEMELFMAGGNYAAAGVSFPDSFLPAVQREIDAARSRE
jgi:nanoRNase/pAp phosphatase (c-di-AMP/oligoRNAs hydrolase)